MVVSVRLGLVELTALAVGLEVAVVLVDVVGLGVGERDNVALEEDPGLWTTVWESVGVFLWVGSIFV